MNKSAFLQLIQQVANISDQQTEELEKVAATFPYCQTAHLLLAKSAFDKGSMLSTQRLRRASAYATNRQLLKQIIYTSPIAEPVFDESAVEAQVTPPTPSPEVYPLLETYAEPQEETITVDEAASQPYLEALTEEQYSEEDSATVTLYESAVETDSYSEQESQQDLTLPEDELTVEAEEAEFEQPENLDKLPADHNFLEQPMEKLDSELALLLTIRSLSPSFTDLLAQKPDNEATEAASTTEAEITPQDTEAALPAQDSSPLQSSAQALPVLGDEESDTHIAPEVISNSYPLAEDELPYSIAAEVDTEDNFEEVVAEATIAPEEAEVKYAFDEIDQMYQQDILGYWMASSRMGEVLQLKDEQEITRERPQGFSPELILEYSKTHEILKQEAPAQPSLHAQIDLIDHFLKLNPRLKAMQHVKMKPEPQEDLSLKSTKIKRGIASESLANIFIKQGKEKKPLKYMSSSF
ncbi:hypothetical protein GCM10028895_06760 [Pontibacter rugosus]